MKPYLIRYGCETQGDKVHLVVRCYLVGLYPLSYTVKECVEDFCDKVGWDFNTATQEQSNMSGRVTGIISFQRPNDSNVLATVQAQWLKNCV